MKSNQVHALMMASNVSGEHSATGARQVSLTPGRHKDPHCHAQPFAITLQPAQTVIIYFHNFAKLHPPPKKTVGKNSKWNLTLPCSTNATNQQWFGGQDGVPHDI